MRDDRCSPDESLSATAAQVEIAEAASSSSSSSLPKEAGAEQPHEAGGDGDDADGQAMSKKNSELADEIEAMEKEIRGLQEENEAVDDVLSALVHGTPLQDGHRKRRRTYRRRRRIVAEGDGRGPQASGNLPPTEPAGQMKGDHPRPKEALKPKVIPILRGEEREKMLQKRREQLEKLRRGERPVAPSSLHDVRNVVFHQEERGGSPECEQAFHLPNGERILLTGRNEDESALGDDDEEWLPERESDAQRGRGGSRPSVRGRPKGSGFPSGFVLDSSLLLHLAVR